MMPSIFPQMSMDAMAALGARNEHDILHQIQQGSLTSSNVNGLNGSHQQTLLHDMASRHRSVKTMLAAILALKPDLNVRDKDGFTPLHIAAYCDSTLVVKELIRAGADLNIQDNTGGTPFHKAYRSHRAKSAMLLIKAGADVAKPDFNGQRPIDFVPDIGAGSKWDNLKAQTVMAMIAQEQAVLEEAMKGTATDAKIGQRRRL